MRGSIGGSEMPQSTQAKRSLIQNGSSSPGLHEQASLAELERELDAVGEAPLDALLEDEAIDDDVEVVHLGAVELDLVAQVDDRAVDARADEALAAQALELELELALAGAGDGREERQPRALGQREDAVDDLLDRLRLDALAAARAVRDADARVEQAQVVGDLGHRADRGARRLRERPLLDGDGRAQALDALDVGLGELLEELPRVGAERLDVAALPLGVDRVEGERRLARAARPGEDDDLAARQAHADVLQVVLPRADDDETIHSQGVRVSTDPAVSHLLCAFGTSSARGPSERGVEFRASGRGYAAPRARPLMVAWFSGREDAEGRVRILQSAVSDRRAEGTALGSQDAVLQVRTLVSRPR